MKIALITPAPPGSKTGNRVTALRWQQILEALGHQVTIYHHFPSDAPEVLVALHAIKSASIVRGARRRWPEVPIILALTGTDLYFPLRQSREGLRAASAADRLIVLQPLALQELPPALQERTHVIYQSVAPPLPAHQPPGNEFRIAVLGHLRALKDPFLAARAAASLPEGSRTRVWHAGGILEASMEEQVQQEAKTNPRYRYLGEISRQAALELLASSHLLVHASLKEGGANVISEAIAIGVPVLASAIAGNRGLLGEDYPGYFPTGDAEALAALIWKAEQEPAFYQQLKKHILARQDLVQPEKEKQAWAQMLNCLGERG